MRALLDTHTLLWFLAGDPRLPARARALIANPETEAAVSVGSLWEVAIKVSLGKLTLHEPFESLVMDRLGAESVGVWGIRPEHLSVLLELPFHHRDPFDRLIIVQALAEGVPVVTRDEVFSQYGVEVIWA